MLFWKSLLICVSIQWIYVIKVAVVWESKSLCVHFLTEFSIDFDEIQYVTATFWYVEVCVSFSLQFSNKREIYLCDFYIKCL